MRPAGNIRLHTLEIARFIAVGGANFVLTLAVFYGLLRLLDLHYLLSLAGAWAVGMMFTYVLNFTWVFKPEDRLKFRERFAKYFAANLASLLLNMLALKLLVKFAGLEAFLAQCALIPAVVGFNYLSMKFWSLRKVR